MHLAELQTPALLLDRGKMQANIARMNAAVRAHGVTLRPHLKTGKCVEVARAMTEGWSGAVTVSTLKEAEEFLAAGFRDILYAVGIAPGKLPRAGALIDAGAALTLILDNLEAARAVADFSRQRSIRMPVLIEIDSDGHRAGVRPGDADLLLAIGRELAEPAELRGVMTHGGGSYDAKSPEAITAHAELERSGAVRAVETLRAAGLPCPVVSVGSTPTALFAQHYAGVTEVRAGVYVFFDLVMAGLGVCREDEIALSVLTSVIGHQLERHQMIVDAGWMALSRDRGTASQRVDQGYGLVCDADGAVIGDLIVISANQEHGVVARRDGGWIDMDDYPVGTPLRVLPNHACATAAQHGAYHAIDGNERAAQWARFGGW